MQSVCNGFRVASPHSYTAECKWFSFFGSGNNECKSWQLLHPEAGREVIRLRIWCVSKMQRRWVHTERSISLLFHGKMALECIVSSLTTVSHPPSYSSYIHLEILIEIFSLRSIKIITRGTARRKRKPSGGRMFQGFFSEVFTWHM